MLKDFKNAWRLWWFEGHLVWNGATSRSKFLICIHICRLKIGVIKSYMKKIIFFEPLKAGMQGISTPPDGIIARSLIRVFIKTSKCFFSDHISQKIYTSGTVPTQFLINPLYNFKEANTFVVLCTAKEQHSSLCISSVLTYLMRST